MIKLTDEELQFTLDMLATNGGSVEKTAADMGLTARAIRDRRLKAAKRGLITPGEVTLPGFEISRVSASYDQNGNLKNKSIQQRPEGGEQFVLPEGYVVKKASVLTDADGRKLLRWDKIEKGDDPEKAAQVIQDAFDKWEPKRPILFGPGVTDETRTLVYVAADWHIGLFAWGKETEGTDWDLSIAREVITSSMKELVEQSPPAHNAIFLGLGDLVHADSSTNMTARSGNVLDVDTRYAKILAMTCDIVADVIEMIATKHENVLVTLKPGNHDENSTVGIRCAIRMLYRDNPRIEVCQSPSPFFWHRFGTNLIGAVHADKTKIADLPLIMANRRADDWAASKTRHIFTAHIHHKTTTKSLNETGGVIVHSVRAPVAQDAYHSANGYLSGRSVSSYCFHLTKGFRGSSEIELF